MSDQASTPVSYKPADLLNPTIMGVDTSMHALFDHLREHEPVAYVEHPEYESFWSLSRYDDIRSIGSSNDQFLSAPRTILLPLEAEALLIEQFGTRNGLDTLIHLDRPKHLKLRKVSRQWFLPRSIESLDTEIKAQCKHFVDKMAAMEGGRCDFVKDIALLYPLKIIMSILGLPPESETTMLKLTQEIFGSEDPDLSRKETDQSAQLGTITDFAAYFEQVIADRKENPQQDLASVLANAEVDGEPMDSFDQLSYFIITATAGHDTTSGVLGAGFKALLEHPEQMAKWAKGEVDSTKAAKELMRWVSPVRHMVRTATEDTVLHGKTIKKGDNIALWYPAANRDAQAIENPNVLDLDRDPKANLAFGYGSHMCLGQHLAVLEVSRFFDELLPRLNKIEMSAEPSWVEAIFVGGLKSMPVQYEFKG